MHIKRIELQSPNPSQQLAFYRDVLGLSAADEASIKVGATSIRFEHGQPARYHVAFNIPENQIEAAKEWLASRAKLLSDEVFDFDFWNAHAVYFEDHDHNILELIARHTLANATDASFGPSSLLEVSEIGLASESPADLVRRLEEQVGLPFYSGDRESFAALGDEHGLFIIVAAGRKWLPTQVPAAPALTRVTIEAPLAGAFDLAPEPFVISAVAAER